MKTVNLGMIGCGAMSRNHAKKFTSTVRGVTITALCDTHNGNLDLYQHEVFDPLDERPKRFADYRDMLAQADLDAVMIITPHAYHFPQAMDALAAGCHVLMEKPMVTRVDHARELAAAVAESGRVFSLAFPGPFSPAFTWAREQITSGRLGEVLQVQGMVSQNWLQNTSGTWRHDPALSGGGQAYDSGAHMFNGMLYLADQLPVEVFAWSDKRGTAVDIDTVATIRFANGALGSATVGGSDTNHWFSNLYLSATKGSLATGIQGGPIKHWNADGKQITPDLPEVPSLQQNFIDCINGKATTPCPLHWGLRQALLMDALYRSIDSGRPVTIDPE